MVELVNNNAKSSIEQSAVSCIQNAPSCESETERTFCKNSFGKKMCQAKEKLVEIELSTDGATFLRPKD